MFLVQIIKQSSSYSNEYSVEINKSFSFTIEKEAKQKIKELVKSFNMKKIGHTFINSSLQEISTNF